MTVYFIQCQNFIKIGHADDPNRRRIHLQVGNPFLLTLIAVAPGGEDEEIKLHRHFSAHRAGVGEWFFAANDILAYARDKMQKPERGVSRPMARRNRATLEEVQQRLEDEAAWASFPLTAGSPLPRRRPMSEADPYENDADNDFY